MVDGHVFFYIKCVSVLFSLPGTWASLRNYTRARAASAVVLDRGINGSRLLMARSVLYSESTRLAAQLMLAVVAALGVVQGLTTGVDYFRLVAGLVLLGLQAVIAAGSIGSYEYALRITDALEEEDR